MTPMQQTILTVFCMFCAYSWGVYQGRLNGIERTINYFISNKMLNKKGLGILDDNEPS